MPNERVSFDEGVSRLIGPRKVTFRQARHGQSELPEQLRVPIQEEPRKSGPFANLREALQGLIDMAGFQIHKSECKQAGGPDLTGWFLPVLP